MMRRPVVIEAMKRRHLRQVLTIEAATYDRHWSRQVFIDELAQVGRGGRHYLIARRGRAILGYGGLWVVDAAGDTEAHVTNIVVSESARREGVGSALMMELAEHARSVGATAWTLEVRASAEPAQAMYQRFGFVPAGIRKAYYEHGEDAVVMWCHGLADVDYIDRCTRRLSGRCA
jgi:ribosomal-protein-alanine N-acetyltransferase